MAVSRSSIKLRGRKLYRDGVVVAEIKGARWRIGDSVISEISVVIGGKVMAEGQSYFRDAVKYARWALENPSLSGATVGRPLIDVLTDD